MCIRYSFSNDSPTPSRPAAIARADDRGGSPRGEITPLRRVETTRGTTPMAWALLVVTHLARIIVVNDGEAGRREPGADAARRTTGEGASPCMVGGGTRHTEETRR